MQKNCPLVPDPKGSRTVRSIDQPARGEPALLLFAVGTARSCKAAVRSKN